MARRRYRDDRPRPDGRPDGAPEPATLAWRPDNPDVTTLIEESEIDSYDLIPWGSNYTFLVTLRHPTEGCSYGVYKPRRGESPLYDFPEGTLYRRERAAYVVSHALGWDIVPPTVIRDGPYGVGMVQLFVEADTNAHYFTFGPEIPAAARRVALFDCVINNTDRKAGHLLRGPDGRVWAIDHGLTFHAAPKLRTVIWDFAGERFARPRVDDLRRLLDGLCDGDGALAELRALLSARECDAVRRRVEQLIHVGRYPQADSYRSMPWPSI